MNEFVMFIGPMFGGKTTKLLSAMDRYKYQGRKILAFKPKVDVRYSNDEIVTHWGGRASATLVTSGQGIYRKVIRFTQKNPCVIAVDEAFMIPGCGNILVDLFKQGNTILVSSLQLSSDFEPYEEMQMMMPYATKIEVCPAVCSTCGADAYYTKKIGGRTDHQIEVGGAEMYQPKCLKHFKNS